MAKTKLKAFINLGKLGAKPKGVKSDLQNDYIVMPIGNAIFIGAKYTQATPPPRTIKVTKGKSAGRSYTKEFDATIQGHKYSLGYADGFTGSVPNLKVKIRWISFYLPRNINLKLFLTVIGKISTKQAIKLKMPSGVTSNLQVKA